MSLSDQQRALCESHPWDFSGLKALFFNCTLKPSPKLSHTEGLMAITNAIFEANGVHTDLLRPVDLQLPFGVQPDMREHGWQADPWPEIFEKVLQADIVIIGTPIWLGDKSSVCSQLIERLYGNSAQTNDQGQNIYYGKVGGCLVTGNEDGAKHCAMNILYSLQHLGFTVPPQANAAWVGEAGPGPSYLDPDSHGPDNDFTNRNATFMSWNLLHFARLLREAGGVPAHGNQPREWRAGCRPDFDNPDYR